MKFYLSNLTKNSAETGHFSIMKKLWDLKKVFSYLELERQGRGTIMGVTRLLLLGPFYYVFSYVTPNIFAASVCRKFANITGSWFDKQFYFNISVTFWKIKLAIPWANNFFFSESQFAVLDLVIEKKIFFKISWKSVCHLILLLKPNQTKLTNDVILFTRLAAHGQTCNKTWRYLILQAGLIWL